MKTQHEELDNAGNRAIRSRRDNIMSRIMTVWTFLLQMTMVGGTPSYKLLPQLTCTADMGSCKWHKPFMFIRVIHKVAKVLTTQERSCSLVML